MDLNGVHMTQLFLLKQSMLQQWFCLPVDLFFNSSSEDGGSQVSQGHKQELGCSSLGFTYECSAETQTLNKNIQN